MYYRAYDAAIAAQSASSHWMWRSYRPNGIPTPYQALQEALHSIREAVAGESHAERFYQKLLELAPTEEDRVVITSIRDDERGQLQTLREIYLAFTGGQVPISAPATVYMDPASYKDGLKSLIFKKWRTNQIAGHMLAAMPTGYYQNLLAKIAVDNVTIVSKLNYLLANLPES
ncbi:ferritin-like domain-containing protein [Paenibacillus soyae]|uniref:Ferritin-like domain-containing protein n=1 Tax=Paenibacillus soyae TaxID=2969249 RepID=A0A9X2SA64_9BACL|nr:ferritin-like domain-containing protein [Paenibacillus soyae]MCR2805760.1 ferritin-like domain-containing protein [Paenibacillus soyae]